jgi:hypothetical protein
VEIVLKICGNFSSFGCATGQYRVQHLKTVGNSIGSLYCAYSAVHLLQAQQGQLAQLEQLEQLGLLEPLKLLEALPQIKAPLELLAQLAMTQRLEMQVLQAQLTLLQVAPLAQLALLAQLAMIQRREIQVLQAQLEQAAQMKLLVVQLDQYTLDQVCRDEFITNHLIASPLDFYVCNLPNGSIASGPKNYQQKVIYNSGRDEFFAVFVQEVLFYSMNLTEISRRLPHKPLY